MSVRIRYAASELGEALKKSQRVFKAGKKSFYVVLNEDSMHFIIFDADSKEVVSSGGNTTNKTVLRLQAKKALEQLGVKFAGENRKNKHLMSRGEAEAAKPAPTPQPEFVRRDEVMNLIEMKVKEILGIIQETKSIEKTSNQNAELAS